MDELLAVLGREQWALSNLLFRVLEARSLLSLGEGRFLHLAASDIESAAATVREVELRRALLPSLGLGDGTLRSLADASPPPLAGILHDHQIELGRINAEVGAALEATAELAAAGLAELDVLALVGAPSEHASSRRPLHSPVQRAADRPGTPSDDLDLEILAAGYEAMLTASAQLQLPSLVAFLG